MKRIATGRETILARIPTISIHPMSASIRLCNRLPKRCPSKRTDRPSKGQFQAYVSAIEGLEVRCSYPEIGLESVHLRCTRICSATWVAAFQS